MREITNFPINIDHIKSFHEDAFLNEKLNDLMLSYIKNCARKETSYKVLGKVINDEFYPKKSKPIIDEIDIVHARHYSFIINYNIK